VARKATTHGLILLLALCVCGSIYAQDDLAERLKRLEEQNKLLIEQNQRLTNSHNTVIERLNDAENRNRALEQRMNQRESFEDQRLDVMLREVGRMVDEVGTGALPASSGRYGASGTPAYGLTRGGGQLQLYGRVRLDTFFNTGRMNRSVDPQWVTPEDGINADEDDDSFVMSARMTTLGARWDLGEVAGGRARAKVEFDFAGFGGTSESVAGVRLLLAYFDIDYGNFSFRFGQDWDIIQPYDPLVDEFRRLWDNGNVGDRRPLAQIGYSSGGRSGISFDARLAVGATGTVLEGDEGDEDVGFGAFLSTEVDGFDSGLPHVQAAFAVGFDSWVRGERIVIGASGLIGALETDTRFNGEDDYTVWLVGIDFFIPLLDGLHLKGEGFIGQALGDFRGGIGQSINQTFGREVETIGGFAEIFWQTTDRFGIGVGAAIDNPELSDLDPGMRASNWVAYVATRYQIDENFRTGFDVMFWKTEYVDREAGDVYRFNYFIEMTF
jgi:hypothetical protein